MTYTHPLDGRGVTGAPAPLRDVSMEAEAVHMLERLSMRIPSVHHSVATLSSGQRESVAVAQEVR